VQELRGRNGLLTGAAGGLGRYIALALAEQGVDLALSDLPGEKLDELCTEVAAKGGRAEPVLADLTKGSGRDGLIPAAEKAIGPLDLLVNNAGLEFGGSFLKSTGEELEAIVDVNVLAVMALTRAALPGMLERRRGHVVNIASLAGKLATPYLVSYSATKHGVVGFTHALRAEYGAEPVGFSAICPTLISQVGMFGRLEAKVGKAPRVIGVLPPERVGQAVVKAIRENRAEVIVSGTPVKPLIFMNALFPRAATRMSRVRPMRRFAQRFAQARGRL
jgi:short-subunit dehydrogenase